VFTCLFANWAAAEKGDPGVATVVVNYADLNLSNPAGAKVLYKRIRNAAQKVCKPQSHVTPLHLGRTWRKCYDTAMADAIAKVNRPVLTALYKERTAKTARG
jgi:UrcA family protein